MECDSRSMRYGGVYTQCAPMPEAQRPLDLLAIDTGLVAWRSISVEKSNDRACMFGGEQMRLDYWILFMVAWIRFFIEYVLTGNFT